MNNNDIPIMEYKSEELSSESSHVDDATNLIINYLPVDLDESNLKTIFSEHGRIVQAKIVRDKVTKKSLGFGFVKYSFKEEALEAIELKNGYCLGAKKIKVSLARQSSEEIKHCKLYITNIPRQYGDKEVIELFSRFGDIIECRVIKEPNSNLSKGVAFVQFNLRSEANRALFISGVVLDGSDRPLHVKFAEEQQKRDKQNRRFGNPGKEYEMDMRMAELMGGPQFMPMNAGPAQRQQSYPPRDMRGYNPYPVMGMGDEVMGWGARQYGSPRGPMQPQAQQYSPYADPRYGRRQNPPMYMPMQQQAMNLPGGRMFGYGDIVGLRVSDLPMGIDANKLQEIFSAYCFVHSADIVDVKDGPELSKQGILQVEDMQQAEIAVMALNGAVLREGHRPIKVELSFGPIDKPLL